MRSPSIVSQPGFLSQRRRQSRVPRNRLSLPSDDSEADDDLLTLKAMSESLSYCEPPGDPEGDTVTGLDCTVPANTGES